MMSETSAVLHLREPSLSMLEELQQQLLDRDKQLLQWREQTAAMQDKIFSEEKRKIDQRCMLLEQQLEEKHQHWVKSEEEKQACEDRIQILELKLKQIENEGLSLKNKLDIEMQRDVFLDKAIQALTLAENALNQE